MIVIGSSEEINRVLQSVSPGFPRQNFESLLPSGRCCYVIDSVFVEVILNDDQPEDPPA